MEYGHLGRVWRECRGGAAGRGHLLLPVPRTDRKGRGHQGAELTLAIVYSDVLWFQLFHLNNALFVLLL